MAMTFRPRAIHQFHGGSSLGDGITNGLFYTRDLLRGLGFQSEIYCADVAPELAGEIHAAPTFPDSPDILLLFHYSWRISFARWAQQLTCRKALVYHDITPEEFFGDPILEQGAREARAQIAALQPSMSAAFAQSGFSARNLEALGYRNVDTIPLLFDPMPWRTAPYDEALAKRLSADDSFKVLFVGRIAANKRQEDLLHVAAHLRRMMERPVKLILPGGFDVGADYRERLLALEMDLGLQGCVELPGKVDDRQLRALYRASDVFLCLSEHEGFCIPLIEAMQFDLPVVAFSACAIAETMGQGGLLLEDKEPGTVAAILKVIAEEPELRRRLVLAGRRNVRRFDRALSVQRLCGFLSDRLDVEIPSTPATSISAPSADTGARQLWRIEGPFDSSYSLALVNRCLARALEKSSADDGAPIDVGLYSTEGTGDFAPDPAFLTAHPNIAALWRQGQSPDAADVVARNLFPPRVDGMSAPTRLLVSWAWEESGLPLAWVERFNRELTLITTVSRFVAKVLLDNGVKVPIAVVGNGADRLPAVPPMIWTAPPAEPAQGVPFHFLHVSSCFPRKGVDILLESWGRGFRRADNVVLVIKTFANPHNDVRAQIAALRTRFPDHADIVVREADLTDAEMASLYRSCDALVSPSRGEGFGLPIAEAMLQGLPVIVTGQGGPLDFCSEATAWLVDYRFAYADNHLGLFNSVWAEPDTDGLAQAMREVRSTSRAQKQPRLEAARRQVASTYSWAAVASRTRAAVAAIDRQPALAASPKVAWVSSWNVRCGIAAYAQHLACAFPPGCWQVMASQASDLLEPDSPGVRRCWRQGWDDDLEELYRAIRASGASHAVIQFNFGFFDLAAFGRLLDRLRHDGVACYVTLHSTMDVTHPGRHISLGQIRDSLGRATRLLVHGVADLNRLKDHGLVDNVTLLPHGVECRDPLTAPAVDGPPESPELDLLRTDPLQQALDGLHASGKRVIACFGYLLPNKGLPALIEAFLLLRRHRHDLHLLMLTALYPVADSQAEAERCRSLIEGAQATGCITQITDYLPDRQAQALLGNADLIVYPYQRTQESASGAVRFGLAARRPVACTPLPIFDDVGPIVHRLPGTDADQIAAGIDALLGDPERLDSHAALQDAWLENHAWPALSRRLWNMLQAPPILDLLEQTPPGADHEQA